MMRSYAKLHPGDAVLVVEDARPGGSATGQIGVYEGKHPRSVIVFAEGQLYEVEYAAFMASPHCTAIPTLEECVATDYAEKEPQIEDFVDSTETITDAVFAGYYAARSAWAKRNRVSYWYVNENPRIRLPDDNVIWGDECWWQATDAPATTVAILSEFREVADRCLDHVIPLLHQEEEACHNAFNENAPPAISYRRAPSV